MQGFKMCLRYSDGDILLSRMRIRDDFQAQAINHVESIDLA